MKRLPRLLLIYLVALCLFSAASYGSTWYQVHILHRVDFPYARTILPWNYDNLDFNCFRDRFHFFHRDLFFARYTNVFNYPAPVAIAYRTFYSFGPDADSWFFAMMLSCYVFAGVVFARALIKRGLQATPAIIFTAFAGALSYPFVIAFYLGNMELLVWVILASGLYLFLKGYGWQAAVLFGIAGSMKYFPLIYFALPLAQKKFRDVAIVLLTFAVSLIGSEWYLGPSVRFVSKGLQLQTQIFEDFYVYHFHPLESGIDHSLFGLLKYGIFNYGRLDWLPRFAPGYLISVALIGGLLWLIRIRKLPLINQILALSVASVLLPPVSHDYTLMHLYAPWAMLVLLLLKQRQKGMALAFACFAVLFTPQSFLILNDIRIAGQLKALVLLVLFATTLWYPFADPVLEGSTSPLQAGSPSLQQTG